jgi:hypothetical protein
MHTVHVEYGCVLLLLPLWLQLVARRLQPH